MATECTYGLNKIDMKDNGKISVFANGYIYIGQYSKGCHMIMTMLKKTKHLILKN